MSNSATKYKIKQKILSHHDNSILKVCVS
jgi:hypothetical protein